MCVLSRQKKHQILHLDYYYIKEGQAAGIQFRLYSSSTAQTSGEEGSIADTAD